mgnify:CR=1 FL=1
MSQQKVVVILKPDCQERSLGDEIKNMIRESGLEIVRSVKKVFSKDEMRQFYQEHALTETFDTLLHYMTSGPSEIMLVVGERAIPKMASLKGRTGSGKGIRGRLAEGFIRNLVHSAETEAKAAHNISLFFPEEKVGLVLKKTIFGLSGMTESGKSTAGAYFDKRGVRRLKIVDIMLLIMRYPSLS